MTQGVNRRTDENIARIREMRAAGKSYHTIGRELGMAHTTVFTICEAYKVPAPSRGRWRNADEWRARCHEKRMERVAKIMGLAEAGLLAWEIAQDVGMTEAGLAKIIQEFNIKVTPPTYRTRGSERRDPLLTRQESIAAYAGRRYEDEPSEKARPRVVRLVHPYQDPVGYVSSAGWLV